MSTRASLVALALVVGCSSSGSDSPTPQDSQLLPGFAPPALQPGEMRLLSPVFRAIQPGQDVVFCTIMANPFSTDMDIVGSIGAYSKMGHHAVLFDVGKWGTPGDTHVCTDNDMTRARLLGGASDAAQNFPIPEGLALRLHAGANIMFQTHWINFTKEPVDGQVAFNIRTAPADGSRQIAGSFTINSTKIDVAPRGKGQTVHDCPIKKDLTMFLLAGHQHEWGTHVKVDHRSGDASKTLYDIPWKHEYLTNAPRNLYPKEAPLLLKQGDTVRVTCDWDNTTDHKLSFPEEMCVAFGMYYPAVQDIDCNDSTWSETTP